MTYLLVQKDNRSFWFLHTAVLLSSCDIGLSKLRDNLIKFVLENISSG